MKTSTRIVIIICATVTLLGVAVLSYLSGESLSLEEFLKALGGFVAGVFTALGLKKGNGTAVLVLLVAMAASACAVKNAQISVQTSLTTVATAVAAADETVALEIPDAAALARARAHDRFNEDDGPDLLEIFQEEMRAFYAVTEGLEITSQALRALQSGLDIWIATGDLGEGWSVLCERSREALEDLLDLMTTAGLEVPDPVRSAPGVVQSACVLAEGFVQ